MWCMLFSHDFSWDLLNHFGSKIHQVSSWFEAVKVYIHQWQLDFLARSCKIKLSSFIQIIIQELRIICLSCSRPESIDFTSASPWRLEFECHDSWNCCVLMIDLWTWSMLSFRSMIFMKKWSSYGDLKFDAWNLIHSFCMICVDLEQINHWLVMYVERWTWWYNCFAFLDTCVLDLEKSWRTVWSC